MSLKPFFRFYGAKWRSAAHYPIPKYDTIVEPFAGSAGYSVRYHDRNVILVERDPTIASVWRYLIKASADEVRALPLVSDDQTLDDHPFVSLDPGARALIGFWLQQGASSPGKRASSWMRDLGEKRAHMAQYWGPVARERTASQVSAIKHWTLIEGGYGDAPDIEATWFFDPPYQNQGKHYKFGSKQIDFKHLAEICRSVRGQAIVCETQGADWLPFVSIDAKIKCTSGSQKGDRKYSAEAIWCQE